MMTDDDIRAMLRSKAAEVRVSDDAWDKISARLQEAPTRPVARRLALAGAAAAAVAAMVFVANLPGSPTSQVATPTTSEAAPRPDRGAVIEAVNEWLTTILADHIDYEPVSAGAHVNDDTATVRITDAGIETEVVLRDEGEGWMVVSASSDMIPLFDVTFDGTALTGRATPEADGQLTVSYLVDGAPAGEHEMRRVQAREDVVLGYRSEVAGGSASVRAILVTDGVTYLSEVTAERPADPATATGSYVAIWPATDSAGLAELQRQADAGERPDLLEPETVAAAFLREVLGTDQHIGVEQFQQGDTTSGEVPYQLYGEEAGTVLLRRTGGEGSVWYVTGAVSDDLEIRSVRREETHLVADVWSDTDGTLTWTGATPIEVEAGQTVSIGKPDVPLGSHPVVVRLMDGDRTLAIGAQLS